MAKHPPQPPTSDIDVHTDPDGPTQGADTPPLCPVCWTPFTRVGRQRYCTDACRKSAWARRHPTTRPTPKTYVPQQVPRRNTTIYACPTCAARYHGQQWCHHCNQPCAPVGPGGACPHCQQPVAHSDLLNTHQALS